MEKEQDASYLFEISKTIKQFYESPVIFVTKKDYSDNVFNAMCSMRTAIQSGSKSEMIDVIADFHLQWLHAVNDIDNFKKLINDLPREDMYQAISYTIDAIAYRLKYYHRYMEKHRSSLSNAYQAHVLADYEIVEEMHKDVTQALLDKLKCFRNLGSNDDFKLKVKENVEDLLQWLDKINDGLAINFTKYMHLHVPHLRSDLTKTLQQIVHDMQKLPSGQVMMEELNRKGQEISSMIRGITAYNLEISKVEEKISVLEDRIDRLQHEPMSAAVMALQHKKEYLERRLSDLKSLRITLKTIHQLSNIPLETIPEEELCACEDFYQFRIFNHLLPAEVREQLVTKLCYLWDLAVFGEHSHKSIISILSVADMKEEFTDELGTYYFDENSRKIYKMEDDDTLYQPNESNELVPLSDDAEHVYYYDECGRYFIDSKTRQRVYKAHATASEYMMDSTGILLKSKEEIDGTTFYYDNYGRYYINQEGKHIYRDTDAASEYENDGLGNLVRIRSHLDIFEPCPDDAHVTEDFRYLKQTVGTALRECIADVILHQPADPIKYLSASLIKYRENMELKDKRSTEKEELNIEREIRLAEERAAAERAAMEAALLAQGGSEASYDSNLLKYTSMHHQDDAVSVGGASSK